MAEGKRHMRAEDACAEDDVHGAEAPSRVVVSRVGVGLGIPALALVLLAGLVGGLGAVVAGVSTGAGGAAGAAGAAGAVAGAAGAAVGAAVGANPFSGVLFSAFPAALPQALWDVAETSVVEEVLFRGALLWGLVAWWGRTRTRPAVLAAALVFGILHLAPFHAFQLSAVFMAQAVLKVAQAALFGTLLGWLVVRSPWFEAIGWQRARCLVAPIAVHFAFDALYLGIPLLSGLPLPETYLTGSLPDTALLLATTLLLAAALRSYLHRMGPVPPVFSK